MSNTLRPLFPHQERGIDGLRAALISGKRRPMIQAPTGSGKTVLAAHLVAGALAKRKRITFCVPAIGLIDQTFERFVENGIDPASMGIIQADHPFKRAHAPVQIATAQTLARREFPICDSVVIDEAHGLFEVYKTWMQHPDWLAVPFIGLSATPWAKGLGKHFDCLIKPTSMKELIAGGYLSPFRVFVPSHPDLSGVDIVAGDYHEGQLAEAMGNAQLVADVVETWLTHAHGLPTLCFAVNRAHAKQLHEQFAQSGVPVAYVDANTTREERVDIGRKLAAGVFKVVCNIGTLTTGIDWDVRCLILARPTRSEMLFVQIIGRALRTAPGKEHAIILDHSDTHTRLGMVDDIDHAELCMGVKAKASEAKEKEEKTPLPRACSCCAALVPAGEKICFACGAEAKPPVSVFVADGHLAEIGSKAKHKTSSEFVAAMPKSEVYRQLLTIQAERGRSSGWVAHAYKEVFGVWPRGHDGLEAMEPCPQVLAMVRAKDIRFAKSRAADTAKGAEHGTV